MEGGSTAISALWISASSIIQIVDSKGKYYINTSPNYHFRLYLDVIGKKYTD